MLSDEIARRQSTAAQRRADDAGLDPDMVMDRWDKTAKVHYDRRVLAELMTLRFIEGHRNVIILGPVDVGKTFLAHALGHLACNGGFQVRVHGADKQHADSPRPHATRCISRHQTVHNLVAVHVSRLTHRAPPQRGARPARISCTTWRRPHQGHHAKLPGAVVTVSSVAFPGCRPIVLGLVARASDGLRHPERRSPPRSARSK